MLHKQNSVRELRKWAVVGFVPVPVSAGDVVFVPRGAKNPNAAILWIVWSVSDEGQKILDKVQFTGNPTLPGSSAYSRIQGKKIIASAWKYQLRAGDILKELLEAMGFPTVRSLARAGVEKQQRCVVSPDWNSLMKGRFGSGIR